MTQQQRPSLAQQMRLLRRAERVKWNRFTISGLVLIIVGIALISYGLYLNTGAYSAEGIDLGIGALIVIAGIIRILIGVINPTLPEDLRPYEEQEQHRDDDTLDEQLFSE
jgi:uncharacterized membrane protein HdeD (DUF308 family)